MTNPEIIRARLEKLKQYLGLLRSLKRKTSDEYESDSFAHGAVEHFLHLAIEVLMDIGNHLLADRGSPRPEEYKDIFYGLAKERILPEAFASRIAPMAGLRNLLVHDYLAVDPKKVYEILQNHLEDSEEFARHIAKLL